MPHLEAFCFSRLLSYHDDYPYVCLNIDDFDESISFFFRLGYCSLKNEIEQPAYVEGHVDMHVTGIILLKR